MQPLVALQINVCYVYTKANKKVVWLRRRTYCKAPSFHFFQFSLHSNNAHCCPEIVYESFCIVQKWSWMIQDASQRWINDRLCSQNKCTHKMARCDDDGGFILLVVHIGSFQWWPHDSSMMAYAGVMLLEEHSLVVTNESEFFS